MSDDDFEELSWEEILEAGGWEELDDDEALALWVEYYLMDFENDDLGDFWEWFDEEYQDIS